MTVISNPKTGEILLGDLPRALTVKQTHCCVIYAHFSPRLRPGPPSPPYATESEGPRVTADVLRWMSFWSVYDQRPTCGLHRDTPCRISNNWIHLNSRVPAFSLQQMSRIFMILKSKTHSAVLRSQLGFVSYRVAFQSEVKLLLLPFACTSPPIELFTSLGSTQLLGSGSFVRKQSLSWVAEWAEAPGDALALIGVIATVGSNCPERKPGQFNRSRSSIFSCTEPLSFPTRQCLLTNIWVSRKCLSLSILQCLICSIDFAQRFS